MWNPWNWVRSVWDIGYSTVKDLYHWVLYIFGTVYDYVNGLFQWLSDSINSFVGWVNRLAASIEDWARTWFDYITSWVSSIWNSITSWVLGLWNQLWQYAKDVYEYAIRTYDYLRNLVWGWISDVYQWVLRNIWDPIWNYVTGLYRWITDQLNYILGYIEHPELLAELIAMAVARQGLSLARRFALPFGRWLVRGMLAIGGEVFDLLETIISTIL